MGCIEGRVAVENFDELQYKNKTGSRRESLFFPKPCINQSIPCPVLVAGNPQYKSNNFVFKCHRSTSVHLIYKSCTWLLPSITRDASDVFSVNALSFHPKNTFCTAGSDGVLTFWDKEARFKLATFENFKRTCPVTDVKFNEMVRSLSSLPPSMMT